MSKFLLSGLNFVFCFLMWLVLGDIYCYSSLFKFQVTKLLI